MSIAPAEPSPRPVTLPSVDAVLRCAGGRAAVEVHGRAAVTAAVRAVLAQWRADPSTRPATVDAATAADEAADRLAVAATPSQRPVFNLTGTVLHTNLGRAILAEAAVEAVTTAMRSATTLEFRLDDGRRGERDDHVRGLLRELTGAQDCVLVNNNAAAVTLVLAALARGRETVVSRGELVEIGGSFRLPAIMAAAGTRLVEVGTTNRTHPADYAGAIGPRTALVMKVHTSNYRVQGFTAEVAPRDIAAIARDRGVPFVDDLGSGTLVDLSRWGLARERTVQDALSDGADLVTFSADKLLGGPQAGIVAGRADLVARLARHPLKRAMRLDKLRLAALEATLRLYRDPDRLARRLPTLRAFTRDHDALAAMAARLAPAMAPALGPGWRTEPVACTSQIGSGALPLETLPSAGVACIPAGRRPGAAPDRLAARLRALPVPVIGRVHEGRLVLDLRCLEDDAAFLANWAHLAGEAPAP